MGSVPEHRDQVPASFQRNILVRECILKLLAQLWRLSGMYQTIVYLYIGPMLIMSCRILQPLLKFPERSRPLDSVCIYN